MKGSFRGVLLGLLLSAATLGAAADHTGKVTLTGVSIPGATVTAKQGDKTLTTITDQGGIYRFADIADGVWTITVSMVGFETMTREVTLPSSAEGVWELTLLPIEKIVGTLPAPRPVTAPAATPAGTQTRNTSKPAAPAAPQQGFQRAGVRELWLIDPYGPVGTEFYHLHDQRFTPIVPDAHGVLRSVATPGF